MIKKIFLKVGIAMILFTTLFQASCFSNNSSYSAKIIQLIDAQNYEELEQVCKSPSGNIDASPQTAISRFFHSITERQLQPTPLLYACLKNDLTAVNILLENGADPNYVPPFENKNEVPLRTAALHGNLEMMELLIEHGANVPSQGRSIFDDQIRKRHTTSAGLSLETISDTIVLFEKHGMNWEQTDPCGENILFMASYYVDFEVTKYLITERKMDTHVTNTKGQTLLHCAMDIRQPSAEYVMLLVAHGVDAQAKDAQGKTAYDYAVEAGYDEIAKLLKVS